MKHFRKWILGIFVMLALILTFQNCAKGLESKNISSNGAIALSTVQSIAGGETTTGNNGASITFFPKCTVSLFASTITKKCRFSVTFRGVGRDRDVRFRLGTAPAVCFEDVSNPNQVYQFERIIYVSKNEASALAILEETTERNGCRGDTTRTLLQTQPQLPVYPNGLLANFDYIRREGNQVRFRISGRFEDPDFLTAARTSIFTRDTLNTEFQVSEILVGAPPENLLIESSFDLTGNQESLQGRRSFVVGVEFPGSNMSPVSQVVTLGPGECFGNCAGGGQATPPACQPGQLYDFNLGRCISNRYGQACAAYEFSGSAPAGIQFQNVHCNGWSGTGLPGAQGQGKVFCEYNSVSCGVGTCQCYNSLHGTYDINGVCSVQNIGERLPRPSENSCN